MTGLLRAQGVRNEAARFLLIAGMAASWRPRKTSHHPRSAFWMGGTNVLGRTPHSPTERAQLPRRPTSKASFHVALGHDERTAAGFVEGGRPWDYSPGPFGRWDRRLSLLDAARRRTSRSWPGRLGFSLRARHVGGGPARLGHAGRRSTPPLSVTETSTPMPSCSIPKQAASGLGLASLAAWK